MNNWFKNNLNLTRFRLYTLLASLIILTLVGVVVANSVRITNQSDTTLVPQNISKAEFESQEDFLLKVEQDEDAPLKILDATVKTVSGEQYQTLTADRTELQQVVSVPKVTLQNVSDKTVVGVTLIINDKGANTNRGLYIRDQSIKPGQKFTIQSENFVRVGDNSAKNPKFWLSTKDKSQVVVRVVANFEDGTQWSNKNFGVK